MKYPAALILIFLMGCSFISFDRGDRIANKINQSVIPQEKELSFESKESLAKGATLQNMKAAQIFYEGTEAKSEESEIVYKLSFDFQDLTGINRDFDPEDPESIKKILEADNIALQEKDKIIHQLKEDVKKQILEKAEQSDMHKTYKSGAEKERKSLLGRLSAWFWGVIGSILCIVVVLFLIEALTKIPVLTGLLGGIRTFWKIAMQTMRGIQEVRNKLKEKAKTDEKAKELLEMMDTTLAKAQDKHVRDSIKKLKKKIKPLEDPA